MGAGVAGMDELREPRSALTRERPAANWSAERWWPAAGEEATKRGNAVGVCEGVAGGAGERNELVEFVLLRAPRSMTEPRKREEAKSEETEARSIAHSFLGSSKKCKKLSLDLLVAVGNLFFLNF